MKKYVAILLIDEDNRILLQHRSNNPRIWNPNSWGTFGGKVEDGETFLQAVIRETKEELDYNLKHPILLKDWVTYKRNQIFYKFINDSVKSSFKLLEGDDWGWFSLDELKKQDWKVGKKLKEIIIETIELNDILK